MNTESQQDVAEKLAEVWFYNVDHSDEAREQFKASINAALAAEREKRKAAETEWWAMVQRERAKVKTLVDALDNCEGQLAAERERADKTMETWPGFNDWKRQHDEEIKAKYEKAISEANWLLSHRVDAGGGMKALLEWANANLTDFANREAWLKQHDAEVRKPLVDLIERLQAHLSPAKPHPFTNVQLEIQIADALAKMKESK